MTIPVSRIPFALSLGYTSKRVYWISESDGILSRNYDDVNTTTVRRGSFVWDLLALLASSVYFQEKNIPYINEMNISSGIISRKFQVDKTEYYRDMFVVHNLLQPKGEFQNLYQYIGGFPVTSEDV